MEYEKMLRFRMKMLSKENLILKIKENTVFSTRGIAALFLLIFSSYTTASSTSVDEFDKKNPAQLRAMAINYKKSTEELQEQLSKQSASSSEEDVRERKALLRERNALLSENNALQEKLDRVNAVQSGRQTPLDIAAEFECLLTKDALSEGPLIIENQKEKSSSLWGICCGAR